MSVRWAVFALAVACFVGRIDAARADEDEKHDVKAKAVIDRVEVKPSVLPGLVRVRALVSAIRLRGDRIDAPLSKLDVKVSGTKPAFMTGYFATAEVELTLVVLIPTTLEFEVELPEIKTQLEAKLLKGLEPLGPRVRVQIIGYGENISGAKSPQSVSDAISTLRSIESDGSEDPPDLIDAVTRALGSVDKKVRSPKNKQALGRGAIILISSGVTINADNPELKKLLTELGEKAGKASVRIHAVGSVPVVEPRPRRPLLALGELSRRSGGTFRWVQLPTGWNDPFDQLLDEISNQYVITFFAPPEELAGKRLSVSVPTAKKPVDAEPAKLGEAKCGTEVCEANAYCVAKECIPRQLEGGRSTAASILLIGGIGVGGLAVVLGLIALIVKLRRPRTPAPFPVGATAAHGAVPGPAGHPMAHAAPVAHPGHEAPHGHAAPVGGPVFIVLTGPQAGARIPLRHGFSAGKTPGNDLDLSHDGFASGNHAQVTLEGGAWMLYDRGSTNGTFSNGVRITQTRLDHGMTIRLGSTDVRFSEQ